MKRFIYLVFMWTMVTCLAHAQIAKDATEEKELQKDIDAFTSANAAKWEELERTMTHLSDSAIVQRAERFANNPFIKAFNTFTQQNADRYAAVRSAKFAQYGPPPPALLTLSWDTTSLRSPRKVIGHIELFSVIFLRSFDPSMIAQVANSLFTVEILSEKPFSDRLMNYYHTRDLFGMRTYVKRLNNDIWQVWSADRSFAVSFRFDVRTGIVSAASRTKIDDPAYAKIQWPHSIVKPATEAIKLSDDIIQQMWGNYPEGGYDEDNYNLYAALRRGKLDSFLNNNRERYKSARAYQLRSLKPPPALHANFKELTTEEDGLLQYADSTYNAAVFLYPEQWATIIRMSAVSYLQLDAKDYAKRVQRIAIFGASSYARQLNDNEWEVWNISALDATCHIWNIRSGYTRNVRYWIRQEAS
jgi:hypothetical protein